MSSSEHLVRMANDIGDFFRSQPVREEAISGIANHISSFWTSRMRDKIFAQVREDGSAIDELPREALHRLMEQANSKPKQSTGGDAG